MKTKCTLIGSILSLISNTANIIFNGVTVFVLWLVIGIGSSLSGENISTLEINLILLFLIAIMLFSIVNICLSSVLLVKRKNRILPVRIIFIVFLFLIIVLNILLILINLESAIIIAFAIFALFTISEFTLILIDTIRNRKKEPTQKDIVEEKEEMQQAEINNDNI